MPPFMRPLLLSALAAFFLAACGGGESAKFAQAEDEMVALSFGLSSKGSPGVPGLQAPMAYPTPAPAPMPPGFGDLAPVGSRGPAIPSKEVPQSVEPQPGALDQQVAALVAQQRIIVRTVDIGLVVSDVAAALDDVSALADDLGGWVVTSARTEKHRALISIRVPAEKLDAVVLRLRGMAVEVDSEESTSTDVTEEYVDNTSRLKSLRATETALLALFDRAETVEEALDVRQALADIQEEMERIEGRIQLLEQTAAFSLVNVSLRLVPGDMPVVAGADQAAAVGGLVRFRATFTPPEGFKDFVYTWDFGDGSPLVTGYRTAPATEEGKRVTATVAYAYNDERDSPFIAEVRIEGTGDAGIVEGKDTLIVTVSKVPALDVFAGESAMVEEGQPLELVGSFTRPEGLTDLEYTWDFGDGSSPTKGTLEEGLTRVSAAHVYSDYRPRPYTATLTVHGESQVGTVEASHSVYVSVTPAQRWVIGGWNAGDQWKASVRALSGVGQAVATFLIWAGIFSPVWLAVGAAVWWARRSGRLGRRRPSGGPGTGGPAEGAPGAQSEAGSER